MAVALIVGIAMFVIFCVLPFFRNRAKVKAKHEREMKRLEKIASAGSSINAARWIKERELTLEEKEAQAKRERDRRHGELADMSETPSDEEDRDFNKEMRGKSRMARKRMLNELE